MATVATATDESFSSKASRDAITRLKMPHQYAIYPDLRGKRVLVTAASLGIGRATALAFATNGAHVAVNGRTLQRLLPVVDEIKALGGVGYAVVGDLAKEDEWDGIVKSAIAAMGGLDILINNGPGYVKGMFADPFDSPRAYELAFRINVSSAVGLMNAALPELLKHGGAVVNVSSMGSKRPNTDLGYAPYGVAKAALNNLTRTWALRYALQGIRVNGVVSGSVTTKGMAKMLERFQGAAEDANMMHAMGRMAEPEEQASAILFLASQAASFITGENLLVEGGWSLMTNGKMISTNRFKRGHGADPFAASTSTSNDVAGPAPLSKL